MGIPSFFSHIIRNYSNIILNHKHIVKNYSFHHLYMDCNSIIYDAVHSLNNINNKFHKDDFENAILDVVVVNITKYILLIQPTNSIYIAFDGVAPFAKMEQQRTRRYKTQFISNILQKKTNWNTSAITPGTEFMDKLNKRLYSEFNNTERKFNVKQIIISGSNLPGEGEHKLYDNIRNNSYNTHNMAIYGLDADLIMLSLLHLKYSNNIFVFREAPEFLKNSLPITDKTDELHFLDIRLLSTSILSVMNCKHYNFQRIYDYVFLCLLLGNDFLPHFPALNIRTHGIQTLIDIYYNCIGNKPNQFIISVDGKIQWHLFSLFLNEISKNEHMYLLNEYNNRNKYDKWNFPNETEKEKEEYIQNIPVIYRSTEKYICPTEPMWETRYYKSLFEIVPNNIHIHNICKNYLEGLEWVFKYYSGNCPNWQWKYNYHYPPLFTDLYKYIQTNKINEFFCNNYVIQPLSPYTQLSYVLPVDAHHLLPTHIQSYLKLNHSELYPSQYDFKWAFCRYFWESHPELPVIPLDLINKWNKIFDKV